MAFADIPVASVWKQTGQWARVSGRACGDPSATKQVPSSMEGEAAGEGVSRRPPGCGLSTRSVKRQGSRSGRWGVWARPWGRGLSSPACIG